MPNETGINPFDVYSALAAHFTDMQGRDNVNHSIARQALDAGDITHDQYSEFLSMPHEKRTQFAAGLSANLINRWKQNQSAAPTSNVIIPDKGAAPYWYVDPRANQRAVTDDPNTFRGGEVLNHAQLDPTLAALKQWLAGLDIGQTSP